MGLLLFYLGQAYLCAQSQPSGGPKYVDKATMMKMMQRYNAGGGERIASSKSSLGEKSYVVSNPGAGGKSAELAPRTNGRTLDPQKMWDHQNINNENRKMWGKESDYSQGRKMWGGSESYSQGGKMWNGAGNYSQDRKMWSDRKRWQNVKSSTSFSTDNRYESKIIEHKTMPHKWYVDNGKEAWVENADVMRELVKASKFENAIIMNYPVDTFGRIRDHVDKISMSDINRYNFRRNHSTEPGLAKQPVGRAELAPLPVKRKDWKKLAKQMRKNAAAQAERN